MADDFEKETEDAVGSALASAIAEYEGKTAANDAGNAPAGDRSGAADEGSRGAAETDAEAPAEGEATEKTPASESEGAEGEPAEKTGATEKPPTGTEPPANWKAVDKETFKKLPPDAQKFLLTRYKEMEAGFTKKTQEIADFRREYDPVNKLLEPYREQMKAGGWTPHKLISAWANAETGLMRGGESAEDIIAGIVNHYRVNLGNVARKLGLRPREPQANGNGAAQPDQPGAGAHDPLSLSPDHPVMRTLSSIQERLAAEDRARANEVRVRQTAAETRVMSEIEEFKSAQDDKGNLLYPHFDEVENDMVLLAQSANAAGKPLPLKDLYERAVRANPSTFEAMLAARERAQQEKAAEEARAKAARARKAGSSVTGAPGPGGQAPANAKRVPRTLDEELEAAFAAHATPGRI